MIAISFRERRFFWLALLLVVCVGVDRLYVLRRDFISCLEQRSAQRISEIARGKRLLASESEIARIEAAWGLDRDSSDRSKDSIRLMSDLESLARESGLTMMSLRPSSEQGDLAVALSLSGDWRAVVRFLIACQVPARCLQINGFKIQWKGPTSEPLSLECLVSRLQG